MRKLAPFRSALTILAGSLLVVPATAQCLETTNVSINGFHNPFLAGQPLGTPLGGDVVPEQAPYQVPLTLVGEELLRFSNVSGSVTYAPVVMQQAGAKTNTNGPEGNPNLIVQAADHFGISGFRMPTNAMLGVFLPDTTNAGPSPAQLYFGTPASRDFSLLQPELYQVFFIGDGLREDGVTVQEFAAPVGATRLFLGSADPSVWNNNSGSFSMLIEQEVAEITPYCTAKRTAAGCMPAIDYTGYPTLTGAHAFEVVCRNVSPGQRGTLFYGRSPISAPFQGGMLCTNVLIKRTPITKAAATQSGAACSSSFTFDFDAWIQSGNDPSLTPGATIYAQWWMRDSQSPSKTGLSDAIEIQFCQ